MERLTEDIERPLGIPHITVAARDAEPTAVESEAPWSPTKLQRARTSLDLTGSLRLPRTISEPHISNHVVGRGSSLVLKEDAARRSSHTLVEEEARRSSHTLVDDETLGNMQAAPSSIEPLFVKHRSVSSTLQEVQSTRMQLRNQRQVWTKQRWHILDLDEKLSDATEKAMRSTKSLKAAWPALQQLREEIQIEQDRFEGEEEKTRNLVNLISELELRHKREQEELCTDIDAQLALLASPAGLTDEQKRSFIEHNTPHRSSGKAVRKEGPFSPVTAFQVPQPKRVAAHPALAAYNDKVGDITLLQERLMELDVDYNVEAAKRESRANLGELIQPSDLEFQDSYHQEQYTMGQQLTTAKAEAERLRSECIEAGIDPDEQGPKGISHPAATTEPPRAGISSLMLPTTTTHRTAYNALYSEPTGFGRVNTGFMPSSERINRWLDHIAKTSGLDRSVHQQATEWGFNADLPPTPNETVPELPPTPNEEAENSEGQEDWGVNSDAARMMRLSQKTSMGETSPQGWRSPLPAMSWNGEAPVRRYSDSDVRIKTDEALEKGWSSLTQFDP